MGESKSKALSKLSCYCQVKLYCENTNKRRRRDEGQYWMSGTLSILSIFFPPCCDFV